MSVTVISITKINLTTVRVVTTEMTLGYEYNIKVSKVSSTIGNIINPAYDNADFFGLNTRPRIVSVTPIDSSHIDVEFDKEMLNGSALAADHSYAIDGPSSPIVSAVALDPSNKIAHLTFAQKILNGAYIIEIFGVPDAAGNPIDLNYDDGIFNFVYTAQTMDMIQASPTYVNGSMISVYASGIATDDVYPAMQLKIDDVVVKAWTNIRGRKLEYFDYYFEVDYFYIHPGQVTIDQIKVEFTNADSAAPDVAGLNGWFQSGASTALVTCGKEGVKYNAKILLTETLSNPSYYNSLRQDMGTVVANKALTATAKFRAPVGTQGRMELWIFPPGLGALLSAANYDGTDEWIDAALSAVVPTGIQLNPELRLITNSPDTDTTYTEWEDPFVGQERIINPDFVTVRDPWTTHIGSLANITLHSEPAGTYAKSTLMEYIVPCGRVYHAMEYDAFRKKTVLFGGFSHPLSGYFYLNDVWEWDAILLKWTEITVTGTPPSIRGRHMVVYDSVRKVFILFGGYDGTTFFDDTWEYNGATATWTKITTVGKPSGRYASTMVYDSTRQRVMLFGGMNAIYNDDTWEYNGATATWTQITTVGKPSGRMYAAMVYDKNKQRCVLFGGVNATVRFDDTWEYNGATSTWLQIVPIGGIYPTHRSEHSMAFDTIRNKCAMFGGQDQHVGLPEHMPAETWEYTAATTTWVKVNAGTDPEKTNPSGRVAFAMVYDPDFGTVLVFGGYDLAAWVAAFWKFNPTTHMWELNSIDRTYGGPSHWNSLIQRQPNCGLNRTFRCKGKYRAAIGTVIRIEVIWLGSPGGALLNWVSTISDFAGSGDWEDFEMPTNISSSAVNDFLELRMVILSPTVVGTWVDWKNISVQKNLLKNSRFRPRTLLVDRVILDGRGYETASDEVYSTGSWLPGDGAVVVPGFKKTELLTNNGNFSFADSKNTDDAIVAGIDARIEAYRKGDGVVHVVDSGGNPINGASVSVTQTRHGFQFGCTRHWLTEKRFRPWMIARIDAYEARWKELFNMALLGFFWANCEGQNGVFEDAFIQHEAIEWAESMGADMKGVAMLYASVMVPYWVNSIDPHDVKARFLAYITHAVTTFGNKVKQWEIVDELALPYVSNSENQISPALVNLIKREGVENLIWEIYNTVKGIDPTASLEINDYNINELYFSLIERLERGGVYPFDAIKIQSHMQEDVWSAQKLFWVLDKLSTYNQNLHMSEISLFSGKPTYTDTTITDWFTSAAGEAAQAIEVERFWKLAFSHQYAKSISQWDLSDYAAWGYTGSRTGAGSWARGLLRPNMTKKPAFDVVHDLIKNQWWTITAGVTAGLGNFNFRGFAGTYDVTVTRSGYVPKTESATLTTAGDTWTITMASL